MSEFFFTHKREDFLPFLFPKKVCERFHKKFRRSSPEVCERFHKKFRRTIACEFFRKKNLDEFRLKNIFLDFLEKI